MDRIKVVLLDEGAISDGGLRRVAEYASEVIVVGQRRRSKSVERLRELGLPVSVEEGRADIESAIRTAARANAIVVVTGRPAKAEKLVRDAALAAASAVDDGLPAVALVVLGEHETRSGKVFTVTDSGDTSGYEPLFALGIAEHLGREVVLVTPPGRVRGPRTNVFNHAEQLAAEAGVSWTEVTDPSPSNLVIAESGSAVGVIIGVLEIPARSGLRGARPRLNEGDPRAAVSLINDAACDVMVIFDGLQLRRESVSKEQKAAVLGLGLLATSGAAAAVTPASAMLGHVTRSITQQARTYRADIGDSNKGAKASDAKGAGATSGASSDGAASAHKTSKPKASAPTASTSTPSGSSASDSKPADSSKGGTSTHKTSAPSVSKSDDSRKGDTSTHKSPTTSVSATTVRGTSQSGTRTGTDNTGAIRTDTVSTNAPEQKAPAGAPTATPRQVPGQVSAAESAKAATPAQPDPHVVPQHNVAPPPPPAASFYPEVLAPDGTLTGPAAELPAWAILPSGTVEPDGILQVFPQGSLPDTLHLGRFSVYQGQLVYRKLPDEVLPSGSGFVPISAPGHSGYYGIDPNGRLAPTAPSSGTMQTPQVEPPSYTGETPTLPPPGLTGQQTPQVAPPGLTGQEIPQVVPPGQTMQTPMVEPPSYTGETPTLAPPTLTGQQTPQVVPPELTGQEIPQVVPPGQTMQTPQQVSTQVPGQVGQGTPTGGGGIPQTVQPGDPEWSLRAQTNTGSLTSEGGGVVPGDRASGTSASSANYIRGESSAETAPAAFGSESGAPPEGELAHTGADGVGVLAGIAASLVAAGSGLVMAGRRREKDDEEASDTAD